MKDDLEICGVLGDWGPRNESLKADNDMKEESEKVGLKLNIQTTKITASGPITACAEWERQQGSSKNTKRGNVMVTDLSR